VSDWLHGPYWLPSIEWYLTAKYRGDKCQPYLGHANESLDELVPAEALLVQPQPLALLRVFERRRDEDAVDVLQLTVLARLVGDVDPGVGLSLPGVRLVTCWTILAVIN
jgi:hypothetical protein